MRLLIILFFYPLCFSSCQQHEKCIHKKSQLPDKIKIVECTDTSRFKLFSFLSLDSVSNSDYYFNSGAIDSISIKKMSFEALYIYCYKALIQQSNYLYLKDKDLTEYNSIMAIHTRHVLLIDGLKCSFNGFADIGCWQRIPESTDVAIESKIYSFFSNGKHLGKIIILEKIDKANKALHSPDQQQSEKP